MAAKSAIIAAWLITLIGGVVLIGAVAALTSDAGSPFPAAYKLAWTAIALEVASLLVTLGALVLGAFGSWKHTCTAMLATVTAILVPICNTVFELGAALPGSNGSTSRAHAAEAGLIIIMTGNFLIMLLSALVDVPTGTAGIARGSDDGKVTV